MKEKLKAIWRAFNRPATHISLGVLCLGGFIAGVIFWGGFNTALEATNTEEFCISCHNQPDNDLVYTELQETVHWSNHSGVRATCPDCHVPHNWTDKIARKVQASKEVFAWFAGSISTQEKFEERRLVLAQHEWDRFAANGSLECKNCHNYASMDWDSMSNTARIQMQQAAERDQSCIDCHKGIAHKLPESMDTSGGMIGELVQQSQGTRYSAGSDYYSVRHLEMFEDPALSQRAGLLNPASMIKVVTEQKDAIQVEINGWRKTKGFGRVINEDFGLNIATGSLTKEAAANDTLVQSFEQKEDDLTGLGWERITVTLWMAKDSLLSSPEPLWAKADEAYNTNCSVCHTQPAPAHFSTNAWPGMFNGMLSFVNLDADSEALVLKYLQKHSSDFSDDHH
ncbi:pentaheme c-type cytochrome TorC [Thaumasiovibrio sp. DFM-14]|uniref:pentaheme c-type cytochrome TorC n=1 Tax=Thaumasiovibrio sp. DFM-14 TaxID=3384792 RepID=UPI0039A284A6